MRFAIWDRQRDPMIKFVRPHVDCREPQQIDPGIERIWRERVAANVERRRQARVDYAREWPSILRRQAD